MKPNEPTVADLGGTQQIMNGRIYGIDTLLQGTEAMRDAGEDFLPRYDQETDRVYENRRERAVLYNYYKRTAQALAGRPFREELKVLDASERLMEISHDIDLAGRSISSFLHDAFFVAVSRGFVGILADHPAVPEDVETLEQQNALNLRPYGRILQPDDFVAGYATVENGREVIKHVRIREDAVEQEGRWGEVHRKRIRVYEKDEDGRVFWELWEMRKVRGREEWAVIDSGLMDLPEIPLTIFYAGERESFLLCDPPLKDLADLNIAHFQSYSDQIHILTVSRFPMLYATGVEDGDQLQVGPNKYLTSPAAEAKFGYVEHTGSAIGAGRQDLQDLEARMATMGVDLMVRRSGDRASATARTIDESRGGSVLQAMAHDFSWAASLFLRDMEMWMGAEDPQVEVQLNTDFGLNLKDQVEVDALLQLRSMRDLSRKRLEIELKRRDIYPETFDSEANEDELEEEGPDLTKMKPPTPREAPESDDTP